MKLHIFTLALDAMPFLPQQLAIFEQLKIPFHWHICEGVADNVLDTDWVAKIPPRFSRDGTSEFINTLLDHPRVTIHRRQLWHGKVQMVNAALSKITEPCVLMQIDADELWQPWQLEKIVSLFETTDYDSMRFFCRFFLGKDIVAMGENCYGAKNGEWHRAFRFKPGMVALKHEPPQFENLGRNCMSREQTRGHGLVFDHRAYSLRSQVEFKEKYYLYKDAVAQWERLQANTEWPVKNLKEFLPWVGEGVGADKL